MKRNLSLYSLFILYILTPFISFALDDASGSAVTGSTPSGSGGTVTGSTPGSQTITSGSGLTNPLGNKSLTQLFVDILDVLLTFAIPIIVIFIMYAGFLYVTAQGDESKIKRAHSALNWSIIGGVIVVGAKVIFSVIENTIKSI